MKKSLVIASFPKIAIQLSFQEEHLEKVSLKMSENGFMCFSNREIPSFLQQWLSSYAVGNPPSHPLLLDLSHLPPFLKKVLNTLSSFPFGSVTTYGDLAVQSGSPRAFRAVGQACSRNPFPLFIPCHRVINSNGALGGFSLDLDVKKELLAFENRFSTSKI